MRARRRPKKRRRSRKSKIKVVGMNSSVMAKMKPIAEVAKVADAAIAFTAYLILKRQVLVKSDFGLVANKWGCCILFVIICVRRVGTYMLIKIEI
jgi:hypothetical protein